MMLYSACLLQRYRLLQGIMGISKDAVFSKVVKCYCWLTVIKLTHQLNLWVTFSQLKQQPSPTTILLCHN